MTDAQLAAIENRINQVFGSAQSDGNSVQAQFSFDGKPDLTLNISPSTNIVADGWSGGSPVIYRGNIQAFGANAAIYGGTDAAHELTHRTAGPVTDIWPWGKITEYRT